MLPKVARSAVATTSFFHAALGLVKAAPYLRRGSIAHARTRIRRHRPAVNRRRSRSACSSSRTTAPRARADRAGALVGLRRRIRRRRRRGAAAHHHLPPRHHRLRRRHAAHGRPGAAQGAARSDERHLDHPAHRAGHRRDRRRGDQGRRLRLPDQAGRHAAAADPHPEGGRAAGDAARGPHPAPAAARARQLRPDHRQHAGRSARSTASSSRRRRPRRRC